MRGCDALFARVPGGEVCVIRKKGDTLPADWEPSAAANQAATRADLRMQLHGRRSEQRPEVHQ